MIHKKEFYFIRHGQTDHNVTGMFRDEIDLSLNAHGQKQAIAVENTIARLPIKTVCFSPLKRAKQTKEIVTQRLIHDPCEIMELAECSPGIWKQMTALGPDVLLKAKGPVKDFMERAREGINQALLKPGPVLIIAHGGVHWAMCSFMNVRESWIIDNCVPVHYSLSQDGSWIAKKI